MYRLELVGSISNNRSGTQWSFATLDSSERWWGEMALPATLGWNFILDTKAKTKTKTFHLLIKIVT